MQSPYSIGIDHTHDQSQSCTHWHCESVKIMLRGKKSIVTIIIQAKSDCTTLSLQGIKPGTESEIRNGLGVM